MPTLKAQMGLGSGAMPMAMCQSGEVPPLWLELLPLGRKVTSSVLCGGVRRDKAAD